ncbi:Lead [Prochlorococcus sp. MIT 0602]|nr:Lead [Prochlorococcus sp. MIT 0602]KGG18218.1 Lead [Prochlorococcus sp. MIT 0603]
MIDVQGMKCGGCVSTVEKTLIDQPNIKEASVNLIERTALIELENGDESIEGILTALTNRGFPAKQRVKDQSINHLDELNTKKEWWEQWNQLMISLVLLLLSVIGHLAERNIIQVPILGKLSFHAWLATFAIFGPGLSILKSGIKSAFYFTPTMDTLVGIGVLSAYFTSLSSLLWPDVGWPCFFNEPVMLLGFVLLGRFLEERARFRTGKALKELAQLQPNKARLLINNNQTKEIRVGALKVGEKIEVLAGDRIPIDGIVVKGSSTIDISSLTGEPLPLTASAGSEISAGTLNLDGTIIVQVNRIGAETALARIIGLVEQAQARKAPIQSLADQVAGNFCYGVVALSFATFIFWWKAGTNFWPEVLQYSDQALLAHSHEHILHSSLGANAQTPLGLAIQLSIAVLVVACPCALGLATPTVISVASGKAAQKGWLFKGGDIIEKAASIDQIIFDKTGTLTVGRPVVTGYLGTENKAKLIQLAASIENNSRHPIAYAILQEAQILNLPLIKTSNVKSIPGKGIYGEIENINGIVKVGTIEWSKSEFVEWSEEIDNQLKNSELYNQSIVAVSIEKELLGLILIDDQVRKDAKIALIELRKQGHKLSIMSGDRRESVLKIGKQLDFQPNNLNWQLLPEEKLKNLEDIKIKSKIAMVGDGINDAPALASADIGIAIGTGTQIAQDSADLVLLGDRLGSLPEAFLLAKKTMNKVKQNLFWAFGYNIIALPIAAGILLPKFGILLSPPIAALLMAISSITVVINALSLKVS